MENHNGLISLSQLSQKTKINHKNLGKYIKNLVKKGSIIIEFSVYDKRKKYIKLNRITELNKIDKWIINDLVELNGYTIDDLRKGLPKNIDIEKLVKELNLEAQVNQNKREKEKREKQRILAEQKTKLHRFEEKDVKYRRYMLCLEKRQLEIEVELNNGLTEQQKEILKIKHEKIGVLHYDWGIQFPDVMNEKYYSASYVNNLVNFIL